MGTSSGLQNRNGDVLGAGLRQRVAAFKQAELEARKDAARVATTVSRRTWTSRLHKRDVIAPRAGRSSTGGQMATFIRWGATKSGAVALDQNGLNRNAPHWVIQEIGTGKRASAKSTGDGGRATGPTVLKTVRRQRGRRLTAGLVWATRGGAYAPPIGARTVQQQLQLASQVTGVPMGAPGIRINREIRGQHFIQKGGEEGFREYEQSALAAARQAFQRASR